MKLRNGFVSNSSSSSFMIYGITLDYDEIVKLLNLAIKENDDLCGIIEYEVSEKISGLNILNNYESERMYIGRSWNTIADDETGKQFKDKTEAIIRPVFGDSVVVRDYEGVIYN